MAPVSRFFQANFPVALLRSAALATLIVLASPARSETLDLACVGTDANPGPNIRLLIDTDGSTVTEIGIGAFGPSKSNPLPATISDQFIKYSGPLPGNSDYSLEGTLDRIAGTLNRTILPGPVKSYFSQKSFACRRATQKF